MKNPETLPLGHYGLGNALPAAAGAAPDRAVAFATAAALCLTAAGEAPEREGLRETPRRFAKAMEHLLSGYRSSVRDAVGGGVFASEGKGLVAVRSVEFFSLCEHHMLPFWGQLSVAYYPDARIVGLSKIPRLVDLFARRYQVQERLTRQVAEGLVEAVAPRAVVVRAKAAHMCMMMRGVEKQQSETVTECALGAESLSAGERDRLWVAVSDGKA